MPRPIDPNAKIDLLRSAEAVFAEHGLEKARVEEITARCGRSKGSFYLHFESKEEAFRQIVESMILRLASFLDQMETDVGGDPDLPQLLDLWREREVELFGFLWQNRGVMRLVMGGGGSAQFGYLIDAFAERARERTVQFLRLGIERGHYREDLDVELASHVISGAYDRIARRLLHLDKKPDLHAWVRGIQRVVLTGIAVPAVRSVLDRSVTAESSESPASSAVLTASSKARRPGGHSSTRRSQARP